MVLAQKQTHTSMEQNKEPRNKPMNLWPINLQKKEAEIDNGENIVSSISGAGKSRKLHIRE